MTVPINSLELDIETHRRLQLLAERRHRTPTGLLQEAAAQYVRREEAREQMHSDAMAAWEDYASTGLHLTAEEMDAWMAALEAGEDVPLPECHV